MSGFNGRAKLQISARRPSFTTALMPSRSPGEVIAEPASMTSTPRASRFRAIQTFSSGVRLTPGVCSPSLKVVSKNRTSGNKTIPSFHG